MKKKKQLTLLIIPEDGTKSIRKRFSYSTLYLLGTLAVFVFGAFAFMVANYSRVYYKALEVEILRRRNVKLEEQWRKIVRIEKDLAMIKRTDQKIRKLLGAELSPSQPALLSSEVPGTYGRSEISLGGAAQRGPAGDTLETNAILLEEIPTIWPARGWLSRLYTPDHMAVDIATATGTPVVSTMSGTVVRAGWDDRYGKIIEIENDRGFRTVYGHNSRLLVEEGERVNKGDVVAFAGSTGLSSAPHLHYEIRLNGKPMDPIRYLVH